MSLLAFINLTIVVIILDLCKGAVHKPRCDENQRKFGKEQRYTCHCHDIRTCQFVKNGECTSGGCMADFKGPNCQKKKKEKGCSTGWFGTRCNKQCHCQYYADCHQATGRCYTGCEPGRHGDSCEHLNYINVAFGKHTSQKSTYHRQWSMYTDGNCRENTVYYGSQLAVDGIFDPYWPHMSCAITDSEAGDSWSVHLTQNYPISQIKLFTSKGIGHRNRLNGTKVYVGSEKEPRKHTCYTIGELEWDQAVIYITCHQPMTGDTVTIGTPTLIYRTLYMCEVEVLQCKDGYFGVACKETCHCAHNSKCDANTGNCATGCAPGYIGNDCQAECKDGYFGVACKETCHCAHNSKCDANTGNCATGCAPGYIGNDCQAECKDGYFGVACKETCHCAHNSKCDANTGNCATGCAPGYIGNDCQAKCKDGYFGVACKERCHCPHNSKCDANTGNCATGCAPGYIGNDCQTECKDGYFGVACKETCHCSNNSTCHTNTGNCPTGCAPGYIGDDCQTACKDGYFGVACNETCHCSNNSKCHTNTGNYPTDCEPGYFGDDWQTVFLLVLGVSILIISILVTIVHIIICCRKRTTVKRENHNEDIEL